MSSLSARRVFLFRLLILTALLALVVMGYSLWRILDNGASDCAGTVLDSPTAVGDIELVAAGGSASSLGELPGEYQLVFFGYTSCPDTCPLTMARLGSIYRSLGEPEELQVVMVTVDPANDTPEEVQAYAEKFHPDFTGLGGSPESVAKAAEEFFVSFSETGEEVAHTDAVFLLDEQARIRIIYTQSNLNSLEEDVRTVLNTSFL